MALPAFEKIREIQEKAEKEIKELRQQATSEIVKRLAEAKQQVRELEDQYTALTGKNLKGEFVESSKTVRPRRNSLLSSN